jgi:predicted ATPase/DNA-binding SARP family transcriptional activator
VAQLEYRILGPLELRRGGQSLALHGSKQRAVLALLLLEADRVVSTDRLVEALWPERPPPTAATALQGYVSHLRKLVGRDAIVTQPPGYMLRLEPEQLDLRRFERLVEEGRLAEALALWRGPPLADFTYEPWARAEIGRLEELRVVALEERIEADLARGRHAELVGELEAFVAEHPLRERPRGQLMLALYRSERQAEALEAYQAARATLVEELGIEPGPELQALNRAILNQDAALTPEAASPEPATNLPVPVTPLVGRRRELASLAQLLLQPDVRLVTLTGPAGAGKTRLGLELAAGLIEQFRHGVWFVALAPLSDPDRVLPAIARALGVREEAREPLGERLKAHLRERRMLLLLDNFEQIAGTVSDLGELLAVSPGLKVLATSRAPLRLAAEHEFPVSPLDLPEPSQMRDPEAVARSEAVALFVERASAIKHDFRLTDENASAVAGICVALDGLPLAIELAAARLRLLPPQALLARLGQRLKLLTGGARDLPARQQTLRGALEWSYQLLEEPEQRLFGRLAVFVGGCSLEAVEAVCVPGGELGIDVLDGLTSLVEKSLLREREGLDGEPRFWMLATIREYALECLQESGDEQAIRRRQAEHYLVLLESASPGLRAGAGQIGSLVRLDLEYENIRAALAWAVDRAPGDVSLAMAAALSHYWWTRGYLSEGRLWLQQVLAGSGSKLPVVRAEALSGAGQLAQAQHDYDDALALYEESLAIRRDLGDQREVARSLHDLGWLRLHQGGYADARALLEESLATRRTLGDELPGPTVNNLGIVAFYEGDLARADELFGEYLKLSRRTDDARGVASALMNLGLVAVYRGDLEAAVAQSEEGLARFRDLGSPGGIADGLDNLGRAMVELGRPDRARELFLESIEISARLGDRWGIAECLEGLAAVAAAQSSGKRAAWLYGAADALRRAIGAAVPPVEQSAHERWLQPARAELGEAAWTAACDLGRSLSLEQALAYAAELETAAAVTPY